MSVVAGTLIPVYDTHVRAQALALVATGGSLSDVSRATGIARSTIRAWARQPDSSFTGCPRCDGAWPTAGSDYASLLGFYLGDGCVSTYGRHTTLRISCTATLPGIVGTSPSTCAQFALAAA